MSPRRRKRLDPAVFQLPAEWIKAGDFTDRGAALTASVLSAAKKSPRVLLQVTAKQGGHLSGIDESIAILKCGVGDWNAVTVHALYEGDRLDAWDTVMTIEGEYSAFAHLETPCLGVLAHRTLVCSNIREIVDIARTKSVFFFGARDEHFLMQPGDGFAATIGGAKLVCTPAQASLGGGGNLAAATVHHSLIAAFGGDVAAAAKHLAKPLGDDVRLLALVDYDNDVARASAQVAAALGDRLWGVRLDTSENMVDKSLLQQLGTFRPTGVSPQLVWNVRNALDADGFGDVRIVVSGGFDAERVQEFEDEGAPVDAYGIGSAAYQGSFDFTADVVQVGGKHQARAGRNLRPNPKLERVK
jgi:nicotinate phosphoribosyltransferase